MKTAIVTDSTAYIPAEIRAKHDIHMIPLNVIFGNESYQEEVDIKVDQFYEEVKNSRDLPSTSQPAIGEFVALYEKLAKEYDAVVSIHLSSGISGTYQEQLLQGIWSKASRFTLMIRRLVVWFKDYTSWKRQRWPQKERIPNRLSNAWT